MEEYTLEIDCPPGFPRPNDIFSDLCSKCNLKESMFQLETKFFGNWTWKIKEDFNLIYKENRSLVKKYLFDSHQSGKIRYASW